VTVTVETTEVDLVSNLQTMVDKYNSFRDTLEELTAYDADGETTSILTGDATALRLDVDLPRLLSGSFSGAGSIRSLGELGLHLNDEGRLEFDRGKFEERYADDPEAVQQFFCTEDAGLAHKFTDLIDRLAGAGGSLLSGRLDVLDAKIETNEERIAKWEERLAAQEKRLYEEFYQMESAVAKLESYLSVINSIKPLDLSFNKEE